MVRILLCDDDPRFLERLQGVIAAGLGVSATFHSFTGLEQISDPVLSRCDIAFLDIDFAGKRYNGIDIARKLRSFRKDAVIIFVTNYIEYAPEGYEVNAFRYVLKSDIREKLPQYLPEALAQLRSDRESLRIQVGGERMDIPLHQILYIESRQHTVIAHTPRKDYTWYAALSNLEQELESKGFLRIHKSYLVNMLYLRKFHSQGAELTDGTVLRVGEKNYTAQKKKYLFWKGM